MLQLVWRNYAVFECHLNSAKYRGAAEWKFKGADIIIGFNNFFSTEEIFRRHFKTVSLYADS